MTADMQTGSMFSYRVEETLRTESGGDYRLAYDLQLPTVPRGMHPDPVDLGTARVARAGGETDEDRRFQAELFVLVGGITVAGGHAEAAMKRLLLILEGRNRLFSLADKQWADLEKLLRRQCTGSDERRLRLKEVLDWADAESLRERRHDAVHGAWWIFAGVGARMNRFPRRSESVTKVDQTLSAWSKIHENLWEYVARLDALVSCDWPTIVLPAEPGAPLGSTGSCSVTTRRSPSHDR